MTKMTMYTLLEIAGFWSLFNQILLLLLRIVREESEPMNDKDMNKFCM